MANATLTMGGVIGLGLAIPILGALRPDVQKGDPSWTPLDADEWRALQTSTGPVKIDIHLTVKDAYLQQDQPQPLWGMKVADLSKFRSRRPDIFAASNSLPYPIVNLGLVIFSGVCPHLGCHYDWKDELGRFVCPCHGSQFDRDGKHIAGPAARGLDPLPLRERSGRAEIEWIRYAPTVPDRIVVSYVD